MPRCCCDGNEELRDRIVKDMETQLQKHKLIVSESKGWGAPDLLAEVCGKIVNTREIRNDELMGRFQRRIHFYR